MKIFLVLTFFLVNLFSNDRIINLAPSINEIVFALGKGDEVVANTQFCNYPKASKNIVKVGGYASISLEKIIKLKPTIVIGQNYDKKLINHLNKLHIKTMDFKTNTIKDIKNTIFSLGEYFQKQKEANKLISKINQELKSLENIVKNQKIMFVIGTRNTLENQIYITGNYLYFEDMIKQSGNKNAYFSKSHSQPVVNVEKIIKLNPDIVILLAPFYENKKEQLKQIKALWKKLPLSASKKDNIYFIPKEYAGIPSQRVIELIKDFRKILEDVRDKRL